MNGVQRQGRHAQDVPHDHAASWNLIAHHRADVIAILRNEVPDADVEDLVHDAMVRLALRTGLDSTRTRGLLVRVARQRAIDAHRARKRDHATLLTVAIVATARARSEEPEARVVAAEQIAAAHALIQRLPRRERQAFMLQLGGYSVVEIAAALGINVKTVEGTLTHARYRLRFSAVHLR